MKVSFLDFWDGFDVNNNFFLHSLSLICDVEVTDPNSCDLIIFSCFGNTNQYFLDKKRIFFTGENLRPNFESYSPIFQNVFHVGKCDYSITFDLSDDERNVRLPLWMIQIDWFGRVDYTNPKYTIDLNKIQNNNLYNKPKDKFCCFVFNSNSPHRYEMINELSKYKKVDCFGKPFGNWFYGEDVKLNTISEYKFNICFENTLHPGYHTEKLIHAKYVGCLPVYWADSNVEEDFNKKSFINLYDFNDIKELVDFIIQVDQDDIEFDRIKNEPLFLEKQDPKKRFETFIDDLNKILSNI